MRAATTEKACFVEDTKLSTNKQHTLSLPVMCAPLRVPLEVLLLLFSLYYLYMCVCLFDGLLYQVINFIFIITIFSACAFVCVSCVFDMPAHLCTSVYKCYMCWTVAFEATSWSS